MSFPLNHWSTQVRVALMYAQKAAKHNRGARMLLHLIALSFPEWRPHFSFLDTPHANEMMALRWLHLIFGIIWIGLLYFFNLVLTPAMKKCDPQLRIKIYPQLMPGARNSR